MRFSFNPKQGPGSRILKPSVSIDSKPLDRNKVCIIFSAALLIVFFLNSESSYLTE